MALTELIFGAPVRVQIGNPIPVLGVVQLDASITEAHSGEAEVTDHPVEVVAGAGASIADHIRALPEAIEINGMVTNTPIVFLASALAESPVFPFAPTPLEDRANTAYWTLRKLKNAGSLLDVVTALRTYQNMAITSFTAHRDAATGNALSVTIALREVMTATSLAIAAPIPDDVANNAAAEAAKKAKESASAGQSETARSTLSGLVGAVL